MIVRRMRLIFCKSVDGFADRFQLSSQDAPPEKFAPEYGNHIEGEGNR
jgi:hypothetical protein